MPSAITKFGSLSSISNSEGEVNQKFSRRKKSETEALQEQNEKLRVDVERLKELVKLMNDEMEPTGNRWQVRAADTSDRALLAGALEAATAVSDP